MKKPTLFQSIAALATLIVLLAVNVLFLKDDFLNGGTQMALLLSALVAGLIAWSNGVKWEKIEHEINHTLYTSMSAIMVLFFVGSIASTWMISGVIPALIHYGLFILKPAWFLPAVVVIASIVSVVTGSSWSTIATIGVAMLGIGHSLGFNDAVVAGAIISGAYFGDKISPLSDTTNLASGVVGTDLFNHVRYLTTTTIPSIVITIIIFAVISLSGRTSGDIDVSAIHSAITGTFNISPLIFIVPLVVGWMIKKRVPAGVTLFAGSLLAMLYAGIFQSDLLHTIAAEKDTNIFTVLMGAFYQGGTIETGNAAVTDLLTTGGMKGMLNTVWLIMCAMTYGGVMIAGGFLETLTNALISKVKSDGGLITTAGISCIVFNAATADQYITLVLGGRMFSDAFKKHRLKPEVLSRTIEDCGTVTSVLIPWSSCGATQSSVLGVATLAYLPFTFFCWISPLMTMFSGWFNYKLRRLPEEEPAATDCNKQ